jgi:hypothetical protein
MDQSNNNSNDISRETTQNVMNQDVDQTVINATSDAENSNMNVFKCRICNKICKSAAGLSNHLRVHNR